MRDIVEYVLDELETRSIPEPHINNLSRRYRAYLEELKAQQRVSLPLYYHSLFPGVGMQFILTINQEWDSIELSMLHFIREKLIKVPNREDKPDFGGIRLTDVLPSEEPGRM